MRSLERLLTNFSGDALGASLPIASRSKLLGHSSTTTLGSQLLAMLAQKNGFYAYESALHAFPCGECPSGQHDLLDWNAPNLWKSAYKVDFEMLLCFAENVFGEQFCILTDKIVKLDPETGQLKDVASSMEDWAELMVENPDFYIGYSLAHTWQLKYGALAIGQRLAPKKPFILGGEFVVENLYAVDAVVGMRSRASISNQIKDVPEGAAITFDIK